MNKLLSKARGKAMPFVPVGEQSQKFYEEMARLPSASNGKKTNPAAVSELVESLKSGK